MILNDDERKRFAAWCRQVATSNKAIIEQMKKLPMISDQMIKRERIEMMAAEVIAVKLENTEIVNVVSGPMPSPEGSGGGA